MLLNLLKSIRTLLAYLFLGFLVAVPFTPLIPFIKIGNYPFRVWHSIDVLICSVAHGTYRRTISGWTGQHMHEHKRFYIQAKIIDKLLSLMGDKPKHCRRAYQSELAQGLV